MNYKNYFIIYKQIKKKFLLIKVINKKLVHTFYNLKL